MSEWISVKDRIPENDDDVLICGGVEVRFGFLDRHVKDWCEYFMYGVEFADNVTHWMPLPEPPK